MGCFYDLYEERPRELQLLFYPKGQRNGAAWDATPAQAAAALRCYLETGEPPKDW
jgi:hypothetical protein